MRAVGPLVVADGILMPAKTQCECDDERSPPRRAVVFVERSTQTRKRPRVEYREAFTTIVGSHKDSSRLNAFLLLTIQKHC